MEDPVVIGHLRDLNASLTNNVMTFYYVWPSKSWRYIG